MKKWIKLEDQECLGKIVHNARCPVCKYALTYLDENKLPIKCYVCETDLIGVA